MIHQIRLGGCIAAACLARSSSPPPPRPPRPAPARRPAYPGSGYFTSLKVSHVGCKAGRTVTLAHYRCRTENGARAAASGACAATAAPSARNSIPTEINSRVTCKKGAQAGHLHLPAEHLIAARLTFAGAACVALIAAAPARGGRRSASAPRRVTPERRCENPRLRLVVRPTPDEARDHAQPRVHARAADRGARRVRVRPPGRGRARDGRDDRRQPRGALARRARRGGEAQALAGARDRPPALPAVAGDAGLRRAGLLATAARGTGEVARWLAAHPEVRTVFVSANAQAPIVVPDGTHGVRDDASTATSTPGRPSRRRCSASWSSATTRPTGRARTTACAARWRSGRPAGPRVRDAAAGGPAARRGRHRRRSGCTHRGARVVDLTRYFCDRRRCLPVVGGVLVHKDVDHLTAALRRHARAVPAAPHRRLRRPSGGGTVPAMLCLLTARHLKPGANEEFRKSWTPDRWHGRLVRAYHIQNQDDPTEVITVGFFDGTAEDIDAMRDDPGVDGRRGAPAAADRAARRVGPAGRNLRSGRRDRARPLVGGGQHVARPVVRFHSGTGGSTPARGTKRERSTSS